MSLTKATYSLISGANFNVLDYGAKGDGVTDDTSAIQSAINAAAVNGGTVWVPAGVYICTDTIYMAKFVYLRGAGIRASTLKWNTVGAGIKMLSPINSSTPVNTGVYDLGLLQENSSNTDGGYVDVCGTYVYLERVRIGGFKYGVIFSQTELGDIYLCEFQQQITAGIWLVNGDTYMPGSHADYTNRISVKGCQINEGTAAYGIVDDGGYAHTYEANNFNGCLTHMRNAGQINVNISNSEFESALDSCLVFTNTRLDGNATGQSVNITIQNNLIIPTTNQYCIELFNGSPLSLIGNYFGNSSVYKITNLANVYTYADINNSSAGGPYSNGKAVQPFIAVDNGVFTPEITFATPGDLAVSYATQIGKYTQVQNRVFYDITIVTSAFTHTTASGTLRVTGLPTSVSSTSNYNPPATVSFSGITKSGYTQLNAIPSYGYNFVLFNASGFGVSQSGINATDVPSGGTVYIAISGSYSVN